MRIRKRKVPLPLSQLSPIPLSDPHLFSRLPVVVQPDHNTTSSCSSDHLTARTCGSVTDLVVITTNNNNSATTTTTNTTTTTTNNVSLPVTGVEGVQMSNDDSSNASITTTCAPSDDNNDHNNNNNINNGLLPRLLSNNEGVGGWCDGDRVVPLKKRRTMVVKCNESVVENEEGKQVMKDDAVVASFDETRVVNGGGNGSQVTSGGKKGGSGKRGNTIMEGSRCSRVNGRGWRCCQQTLVGYSLCEHHLGKGRLRSMTSSTTSKSRSKKKMGAANNATYPVNTTGFALGSHDDQVKEKLVNGDDEKKMERMSSFGSNSKRVKLGVVKARSLSSLLGQTNSMNNNNIVGDHHNHANMQQQEKISN